ncbi:hypothetical protein JXA12_03725 [Candidatus Woesearchaeota archaeon]|nr:hypothetical protein [Candidatus Woesearchaeota archaeon]
MADIKITYETLFDLLRRERNREELQKLDPSFYADVLAYLAEKQALLERHGPQRVYDVSADAEKARIQFHNIKRILRELYDRREKKLVLLALSKVRTGAHVTDAQSLLPEERSLLDELTVLFSKHRVEVLEHVLRRAAPAEELPLATEEQASGQETPLRHPSSEESPVPRARSAAHDDSPEEAALAGGGKVRFVKAVPRFAGGEGDVFGPFSPGDEASLPEKIAEVLVRKGRAEQL